eukprot:GHVR01061374.1.p1 GENE.GHVR01061374.1~~GHVR01061374.1.p1  ORF type:complete len:328 (-),score=28.44 GHVR01061374.1:347-1330(-)
MLQDRMREVTILLIDEMSMIGLCLLGAIDDRLRQIMCKPNILFGGVFLVLCGDIGQLPPVGDTPLWASIKTTHPRLALNGKIAYDSIKLAVVLNEVKRQIGGDADRFVECLNRCRDGTMWLEGDSDVEFLSRRYSTMLPVCEQEIFNLPHVPLRACGKPLCFIVAVDVGENKGGPAAAFGNLEPTLTLCDDARVMLTRNNASSFGLVNGSFGYLRGLVYTPHESHHHTLPPRYALVDFDTYKGPQFFKTPGRERWVTIPCSDSQFGDVSHAENNRNQLPLMLAWAFTIHKSQGSTLVLYKLDLGTYESQPGLAYVALSRGISEKSFT